MWSACTQWLWWESGTCAGSCHLGGGGAGIEGARAIAGASLGSPVIHGHHYIIIEQGPAVWSRCPGELGSSWVLWQFLHCFRVWVWPQGLGLRFCARSFFPSRCTLTRGYIIELAPLLPSMRHDAYSESGSLQLGASPTPCWVRVPQCELATAASALVRHQARLGASSMPSKCTHSCWQQQPPPRRSAGVRGAGAGTQARAGACTGAVLAGQPEPQAVCNPLPPAVQLWVSKSVTGPLRAESWFLTALWEALWFSN